MNGQEISAINPDSKRNGEVTSGSNQDNSKTEKIFRITTTLLIFHERLSYVAAESAAEAMEKHEDGFSTDEPPDWDVFEEECFMAKDDATTGKPFQVTDPDELEYARRLINEQW
jgi:hypothetical protein